MEGEKEKKKIQETCFNICYEGNFKNKLDLNLFILAT